MIPSPFKSSLKLGSIDSNAALVPDTLLIGAET